MDSTEEKVWQGDPAGLQEQLTQARKLKHEGKHLEAYCMYASAYYSHYASELNRNPFRALYEFWLARQYAWRAFKHSAKTAAELSYGHCDVLGNVFLEGWLWLRPDVSLAMSFLHEGLSKPDVPPHARALMTIAKAKGYCLLGNRKRSEEMALQALSYEDDIKTESDQVQAHRQFTRVLRRAMTLAHAYDGYENVLEFHTRALRMARDPRWRSRDQINKIYGEWRRLHRSPLAQAFLPY